MSRLFKNSLTATIFLGFFAFVPMAVAEREGHGGDAVQDSQGQWTLLDLAESLPHNYIDPLGSSTTGPIFTIALGNLDTKCSAKITGNREFGPPILGGVGLSTSEVVKYLYYGNLPNEIPFYEQQEIPYLKQTFGPQMIWIGVKTPLEHIKDEGAIRINDIHTERQLAIQRDGVVLVYMPIFNTMSETDQAALVMHETLLRMVLLKNPTEYQQHGTQDIRELVKILFDYDPIPTPVWDQLCGSNGSVLKDLSN